MNKNVCFLKELTNCINQLCYYNEISKAINLFSKKFILAHGSGGSSPR